MIRINLLPFRAARKQENVKRQVLIFAGGLLAVILVLAIIHMQMVSKVEAKEKEIATTKAKLEEIKKLVQEVRDLKKRLAMIEDRRKVIDSLAADRTKAVHMMDDLTQWVVPKRMWITNLDDTAERLKLNGMAFDNETVAKFLSTLKSKGDFRNVELVHVSQSGAQGYQRFKEFEVLCWKKSTDPEAAAQGAAR